MATGRAILQAHMDSLLPESIPLDFQWTLPTGILGVNRISLNAGDNTLTVPAGTLLIILVPPTTNAATLIWSKTGGTTNGIQQPSNLPNITAYSAGAVIVNSSGLVSGANVYYLG